MLRWILVAGLILIAGAAVAFWVLSMPETVSASALPAHKADLANGKVVFDAGGCTGCHQTPNQDDRTRLGGGVELKSPFGTFYAPNISTDPNDGIGRWTEAQFVTAMLKGTSPDGRHYFPSFPYTTYQRMTLADARDLFAYLKTLPAVQGKVRDHEVPFPFNIRRLVGGWKFLYLDGRPFTPDPNRPAEWNRGAYLVNALSHCAECHSPRNALGAIIESQRFSGGPDPEGGDGTIPDITQGGIGNYSLAEIEQVLETGETPEDKVGGSMIAVVRSTSQLPAKDRAAMAAYIKTIPAPDGGKPSDAK
jgi:mono/diheme cytochrome c family protein